MLRAIHTRIKQESRSWVGDDIPELLHHAAVILADDGEAFWVRDISLHKDEEDGSYTLTVWGEWEGANTSPFLYSDWALKREG